MESMNKLLAFLSLAILFFGLNACSSAKKMNVTDLLLGKSFNVESIAGKVLNAADYKNGLPSFNFGTEGKLNGNTGCNNFNGNFKVDGGVLNLNPGAMTRMACPGSGEADFLNALKQVTGLKQEGSKLKLLNGATEIMSLIPKL
jgi:heat shock protein HslJ